MVLYLHFKIKINTSTLLHLLLVVLCSPNQVMSVQQSQYTCELYKLCSGASQGSRGDIVSFPRHSPLLYCIKLSYITTKHTLGGLKGSPLARSSHLDLAAAGQVLLFENTRAYHSHGCGRLGVPAMLVDSKV